jgi:hypothetical protein
MDINCKVAWAAWLGNLKGRGRSAGAKEERGVEIGGSGRRATSPLTPSSTPLSY